MHWQNLGTLHMTDTTVRLTVAQAIIRYLDNQFIKIDGEELFSANLLIEVAHG